MAISLCLTFLEARLENTRVKRSPATLARPHHVYKLMSKVNVTLIVFWEIDLKSIPFSEVLLSTCLLNVFSAYISEVSLATSPPLLIAIIVGSVVVFLAIVCCGVYVKCNQRAKKKNYACKPRQDGVYKIIRLYICECNLFSTLSISIYFRWHGQPWKTSPVSATFVCNIKFLCKKKGSLIEI